MKYIIILLTILISSCNLTGELYISDWKLPIEINTKQEALDYVNNNYTYVAKNGCFLPEEFYYWGYGDCEDMTLMLQHIFEVKLGIDAYFVIGYFNGSTVFHAWLESGDLKYEASAGMVVPPEQTNMYVAKYKYTYIEAMRMVQAYGGFVE